jgi:DNA replication protein DnaC
MPHDQQQRIIAELRDHPTVGYAFFGPSGWSKSTFLYALYREALLRHPDWELSGHLRREDGGLYPGGHCPVIFVKAAKLMDSIEAYKFREGRVPPITDNAILRFAQRKQYFSLFIDELDKVRDTKFRKEETYKIIDACYMARPYCQLVIAGNMKEDDLKDVNQYEEGTWRRIDALCTTDGKCRLWELGN